MGANGHPSENSVNKATFATGCAVGLIVGITATHLFYRQPGTSVQMAAGTDFGVLADEVMALNYRSNAVAITAQRAKSAQRFALQATFANGSPPQQCIVSADLAGLLATLSTITVKRQLPLESVETDFPKLLGYLDIRSSLANDEGTSIELRESANGKSLAARYAGAAMEIANPASSFEKLAGGCSSLAE